MAQSIWSTHWSGVGISLELWSSRIQDQITDAEHALAHKSDVPALDILIRAADPSAVIPQLGLGAWAMSPSLVVFSCAPDTPQFETALADGAITRLMIHEANHCLRWSAGSHPRNLGEALVSEGLAGHFVQYVLSTPPELWETCIAANELWRWWPSEPELNDAQYDHGAWFFGAGNYPNWLGYSLGFDLVGRWLDARAGAVHSLDRYATPASQILSDMGLLPKA